MLNKKQKEEYLELNADLDVNRMELIKLGGEKKDLENKIIYQDSQISYLKGLIAHLTSKEITTKLKDGNIVTHFEREDVHNEFRRYER